MVRVVVFFIINLDSKFYSYSIYCVGHIGSSTIKASLLVEQKKVLPAVIENRASLLVLADQLLKQLEEQLENLLRKSDMTSDNTAKKGQSILKIMEEVKCAKKNAAKTPPSGSMSSIVKRSLGFLVSVRDCNALAWAKGYVDKSKVAHANGGSGEDDKRTILWCPLVDRCYPFGAIKNRVVETQPTTLNIFARLKKVKAQQAGERGKEVEPKEVGVFRLSEPGDCVAFQTISSEGETLSIDLPKLSEGKYAIFFVQPGTEAGPKTAMCSESDPKLTVEFVDNDRRDDDDSDRDGDYSDNYDDDDEEDDYQNDDRFPDSQSDNTVNEKGNHSDSDAEEKGEVTSVAVTIDPPQLIVAAKNAEAEVKRAEAEVKVLKTCDTSPWFRRNCSGKVDYCSSCRHYFCQYHSQPTRSFVGGHVCY